LTKCTKKVIPGKLSFFVKNLKNTNWHWHCLYFWNLRPFLHTNWAKHFFDPYLVNDRKGHDLRTLNKKFLKVNFSYFCIKINISAPDFALPFKMDSPYCTVTKSVIENIILIYLDHSGCVLDNKVAKVTLIKWNHIGIIKIRINYYCVTCGYINICLKMNNRANTISWMT
jgi:hypothetical protein